MFEPDGFSFKKRVQLLFNGFALNRHRAAIQSCLNLVLAWSQASETRDHATGIDQYPVSPFHPVGLVRNILRIEHYPAVNGVLLQKRKQ
jgi:hypothetical protein